MSTIQTVQGALSRTTILAKAEKDEALNKEKKVPTFHQRQAAARAKDPENGPYQKAINDGDLQASTFLAILKHPAHPDHEANLQVFKNEHGMDPRKTVEAFRAKACKDASAYPYESRDYSYEQNVLKPYKPTGDVTRTTLDFYDNMKKALNDKHEASGYKGDKAFIESYANKYGLTRNDSAMEMKNIQPKD